MLIIDRNLMKMKNVISNQYGYFMLQSRITRIVVSYESHRSTTVLAKIIEPLKKFMFMENFIFPEEVLSL